MKLSFDFIQSFLNTAFIHFPLFKTLLVAFFEVRVHAFLFQVINSTLINSSSQSHNCILDVFPVLIECWVIN